MRRRARETLELAAAHFQPLAILPGEKMFERCRRDLLGHFSGVNRTHLKGLL
jgi:hypothetical protein